MTPPISVEMHFLDDLRQILCERMSAEGYTVHSPLSVGSLLWNWLRIQRRKIECKKRRTEISKELAARLLTAPPSEANAIARTRAAVEAGDDLNLFLSRQIWDDQAFEKTDPMLDDMGIYHFHMGEGFTKGVVTRSGPLVFGNVTSEAVYLIGIYDHKRFGDEDAFRVAQRNWPHLFKRFRLPSGPSNVTPEQRRIIRKRGGNAPIDDDQGNSYLPPGGGVNPAGFSILVVIEADRLIHRLKWGEQWCSMNAEAIASAVEGARQMRPTHLNLRLLQFDESGRMEVAEESHAAKFWVP